MGTVGVYGVTAAFQKVGLGNSTSLCCNRVCLASVFLVGVVTVMHLVAIHLKDIDRIEVQVLNQVVEMQVGAEGGPLGVEGDGPAVGDVAAAHGCLRITEITR